MSVQTLLAARAHVHGRAQRSASLRHRRLLDEPMAVVFWQLGAELFSTAAIGYGRRPDDLTVEVAGDPRNRDLAFRALMEFAGPFIKYFEAPAEDRTTITKGSFSFDRSTSIPQLIVANSATVTMIGNLGRRLAYLSTDGPYAADPQLIRLGQHLMFIARHSLTPGQQLIVSMTDLTREHWVTALSDYEAASLSALDAYIEPPAGTHGFHAATQAEIAPVGPQPEGELDTEVEPLMLAFNDARNKRTETSVVLPLLVPIAEHYFPLVEHTFELTWRSYERERALSEAPSVERRFHADCDEYIRHIDWTNSVGHRRTRQTHRQAALSVRALEDAEGLLQAEEATDDPLRMVGYLLDGKALDGEVVGVDENNRELVNVKRMRRPLVTISCEEPCRIPRGRTLYWTQNPHGKGWMLEDITPTPGDGTTVTMKLLTDRFDALPSVGERACFSILHTDIYYRQKLPRTAPWTHTPAVATPTPEDIEESQAA
jgi:hypothetical protein